MKQWVTSHRFEIIILLLALVVRLVLFSVNLTQNDGDLVKTIKGDDGYYELSQSLNAGNGFSFDPEPPYRPNPLRPPLWPFLIAFFAKVFGTYWAVFVLEILMGSFIPILGMRVARYVVGERAARVVAVLLALEPYSILLSFILYTETAFTFFFLLFLLFLFRYIENQTLRNAVWAGVLLGLACMIKPTIQFFPILIPLALVVLWRKKLVKSYIRDVVVFVGVFFVIISPWLYRNHVEFGVWGISAQPAFNLYVYLVPTVLAIDNGTDFRTEYLKFVKKDNFDENNINLANGDFYKQQAIEVLKEHKLALVKTAVMSSITFFTHDGMLTVLQYSGIEIKNSVSKPVIYLLSHPVELCKVIFAYAKSPAILILVVRFVWVLITLLCIIGTILLFKKEGLKPTIIAAVLITLYFVATTWINGFGVNARFRIPINVFLFSFAIYAVFVIKERTKSLLR